MTISSYLLILYAVIQVIGLVVMFTVLGRLQDVYRDIFAGTGAQGAETIATFSAVAAGVVMLLFAIGLVVLAVLNNRGKNPARIVTWVLGGLAVCCGGVGVAGRGLGAFTRGGPTSGNMPSQQEIQRRVTEALPSWYEPLSTTLGVIGLLALLAALILLALPASNAYFRKPQPAWGHPEPGYPHYPTYPGQGPGGYPGQPGYPAQPGHPGQYQPPGQPGQYPTPGGQPGPGYPPPSGEGQPPSGRPGSSAPPPAS